MNISDRILNIIHNEGISIRSLEQTIGCSNGVLSRSIQKGTDISSNWLSKIIESYPKYNSTWLLTGDGSMLLDKEHPPGIIEDPGPNYGCKECKMKDELIDSLRGQIRIQDKLIKRLESERSSDELEQKRKAAS